MKSHHLLANSKNWNIIVLVSLLALACLITIRADAQYVIAPIVATLLIALLFWQTLTNRRGEMPIVDLGSLTVLATTCYTIIPLLQFLLSGMQHTSESAFQLYILAPTPKEFGTFAWWYVVYLLCFVIGYLITDSKSGMERSNPIPPDSTTVKIFVLLFIILSVMMFAIEALYGINLYGVYDSEHMYDSYETFLEMPLLFRQIYGIIGHNGIFFIVKLGLLLTIFLNWKRPFYRHTAYAWLLIMLVTNILWTGARTELVLTFLAVGIMYHRFVKPLTYIQVLPAGTLLFSGFIILGIIRGSANLGGNLDNASNILARPELIFSTATEFQVLFGGNYDLLQMKQNGHLGDVPLQIMLYDLLMIIPQQILPFPKIDIQQWVTSRSYNPGYFMFNPISQAIIGLGWVELILRGLFLGFVFAKLRAWYTKRTFSFWATLFYFYLMIISYYTIRGTAIYIILSSTLLRFIPLYFFVWLFTNRRKAVPPIRISASRVKALRQPFESLT